MCAHFRIDFKSQNQKDQTLTLKGETMSNDYTFRMSRTFDAPIALMWKAWTDKSMAGKWFGPKGCTITYSRFDIKPGGEARYAMEFNGAKMFGKWSYKEVVPQKKLVSVVAFTDETGDKIISHPGQPGWPKEMFSTITFIPKGEKTEVLIEWQAYHATDAEKKFFAESEENMKQGWGGSLDRLEEFLSEASPKAKRA
jgi:uncharacterized protein YndB with AHSA1/START domain